jgi:hypothetical protein
MRRGQPARRIRHLRVRLRWTSTFAFANEGQAWAGRVLGGIENVRRSPMRLPTNSAMAATVALLACAWPAIGATRATPVPVPASELSEPAATAARTSLEAPAAGGLGVPISSETLQSMRGGDSTTTNDVDLQGGVDGNSANNVVSGLNIIQDGSFANASGISTVIQNSGSNVLIQNGTIVNVQFVDPTP